MRERALTRARICPVLLVIGLSALVCGAANVLFREPRFFAVLQEVAGSAISWWVPLVLVLGLSVTGLICALAELFYLQKERNLLKDITDIQPALRQQKSIDELCALSPWLFTPSMSPHTWRGQLFRLFYGCSCTAAYLTLLRSTQITGQHSLLHLHHSVSRLAKSSHAATLLRLLTQILLIIGICGTLYGVYGALHQGIQSLDHLAPVLRPGAVAIFATIVLVVLRHYCQYRIRVFLEELDTLGLTQKHDEANRMRGMIRSLSDKVQNLTCVLEALTLSGDDTEHLHHFLRPQADSPR